MFRNIYIYGLGMMGGSLAHFEEKKFAKKYLHMIRI